MLYYSSFRRFGSILSFFNQGLLKEYINNIFQNLSDTETILHFASQNETITLKEQMLMP